MIKLGDQSYSVALLSIESNLDKRQDWSFGHSALC